MKPKPVKRQKIGPLKKARLRMKLRRQAKPRMLFKKGPLFLNSERKNLENLFSQFWLKILKYMLSPTHMNQKSGSEAPQVEMGPFGKKWFFQAGSDLAPPVY